MLPLVTVEKLPDSTTQAKSKTPYVDMFLSLLELGVTLKEAMRLPYATVYNMLTASLLRNQRAQQPQKPTAREATQQDIDNF